MASMLMMKSSSSMFILRLSNNFHSKSPSLFPLKLSRLSFASASNFHQAGYTGEESSGKEDPHRFRQTRQVYESDEEADEVEKRYKDMKQKAQETTQGIKEKAKEGSQQAAEAMQEAKEMAQEQAKRAKEKVEEGTTKAKEGTQWASDKTKDGAQWANERTKDATGKVAETVQNVGEKAKETAKGAWEKAKDATQKIKETVVGKEDNDDVDIVDKKPEDYVEDQMGRRYEDHKNQNFDR